MFKIIDKKGSGKTSRLLLLAKENEGIVVCRHPEALQKKAVYSYGIIGVEYMGYGEYLEKMETNLSKPVYIDEISSFLKYLDPKVSGYSESLEEEI